MREAMSISPAGKMTQIQRRMRWIAIVAPLALFALVAVDGISWTDIGIVGFVAVILWLFVVIGGFTRSALERAGRPQDQ